MTLSEKAAARRLRLLNFANAASVTPDHPGFDQSVLEHERLSKSKTYRRHLKEMANRSALVNAACFLNGPGIFADAYIRNFLLEYNNRVFKGLGLEQPTSFNVMREFLEPDEKAFVLKLLDEKIYQCSLPDYLDFITSEISPAKFDPAIFEELRIYEFNSIGPFSQIMLPDFGDIVFCGAALVREHDEISILGVFGDKTHKYRPVSKYETESIPKSKRELFEGIEDREDKPQPLFDNEELYPLLALTRIDLVQMSIQVQYLLQESQEAFRVVTDDPTIYFNVAGEYEANKLKAIRDNSITELAKYHHIFDFLYHLIHFPSFYERYEDDFYVERHPTRIKIDSEKRTVQKIKTKLEPALRPTYREVLTLSPQHELQETRSLESMNLRRETSGFWKTLPQDHFGTDKNGNKVQGKTWVKRELTWTESANATTPDTGPIIVASVEKENVGFVYVMRSPVHERHIYKIGFTNREPEQRATDISATSGQPDYFAVVQSWKVFDPQRVERAIHRQLDHFRIADRREFFKIRYEDARKVIEETIGTMRVLVSEK